MEIYEIENPFWLSDIFIFEYVDKVGYCYVKVNYQDKIEEIGINISKRMHNQSIANILLKAKKATNNHKSIFSMLGDQYWLSLFKKHNQKNVSF